MLESEETSRKKEAVEPSERYVLEPAIPLQIDLEELPLIFSEGDELAEWEKLIESLTTFPFDEDRESEIQRLDHLFDAFAHRYKRDLRTLTRMRTQVTNTVMHSSAVLLEDRFEP